jgi:hypothetical protein
LVQVGKVGKVGKAVIKGAVKDLVPGGKVPVAVVDPAAGLPFSLAT